MSNVETVEKIIQELSKTTTVEFACALLRPHSYAMYSNGELTENAKNILEYGKKAGRELVKESKIKKDTLDRISHPLITKEQYMNSL